DAELLPAPAVGEDACARGVDPNVLPRGVCGVLQSGAHAPGITERCALASSSPTVRCRYRYPNLVRTASSIRPDMIFGKDTVHVMRRGAPTSADRIVLRRDRALCAAAGANGARADAHGAQSVRDGSVR